MSQEPAPWSAPDAAPGPSRIPVPLPAGPPPAEPVYAPRPGGIPLRPLGVGDVLDGTFTTIRHNPRATIGLAALLVTLQQLLVVGAELLTGGFATSTDFGSATLSLQLLGGFGGLVSVLLTAVVGSVLTGMLVVVVSEDVLGRRVTVGEVWARIRPRIWALLAAAAIAGLLPYVGLVFLLVPGVILWVAWAVTTPALVLEGLGPVRALRRSWQLVWPDFFRVFGIRSLSVLLAALIQYLVLIPVVLLGLGLATLLGVDEGETLVLVLVVLLALGGIGAGTLTEPFLAGVLALLYVDRRMRAEGLDLVIQLRSRVARAAPVRVPAAPGPSLAGGP